MFVGHHGVAFAAKRIAPRVSLGTLMLAALFPDLLVFGFLIAGVEHIRISPGITAFSWLDGYDIALSHSLLMDIVWSALFGAVYFLRHRDTRGAWVLCGLVLSHWVLDAVSHRPEIPLAPGLDTRIGLGLWNSLPATFVVEGGLWAACLAVYVRATAPKKHLGTYAFFGLAALLTVVFISMPFRAAPPSVMVAIIVPSLASGVILAWSYWVERLRTVRGATTAELPIGTMG
jgi:membrane-bound metal-dependent hydrolase YbcI (DUF457 family)